MKKIILFTIMALCICTFALHAQTTTNNDAGVQLTPAQIDKLDNSITTLLPLIPAKYQAAVAGGILVLSLLAHCGRFLYGWASGGFFSGLRAQLFGSKTVKLLLFFVLPALIFSGCKSYQLVESTSATGVKINASVPVPGTGATFIGLSLMGGTWKDTTILQPTETNGVIASPSVVVAQSTRGKGTAAGNVTTNANGSIVAGVFDQSVVLTGQSTASVTNNPNELIFTTEK